MPRARPFTALEQRIDDWAHRRTQALAAGAGPWRARVLELVVFTLKQAWACVFGASMLALLVIAKLAYPDDLLLARSDALVLAALTLQILMLAFRLETAREMGTILLFHVVGTAMEVFKTHVGSWQYEPDGLLRIGAVPLYTGFMYAAVGSYMVRVMRLFDLTFTRYPPRWVTALVAAAIYANFFTHHFLPDARWVLLAAVALLYGRCVMSFRNHRSGRVRRMPVLAAFAGTAFLLWVAENIGTAAGAWVYPSQQAGWEMVPLTKMVAWLLLMMISVVLVTLVHRPTDGNVDEVRSAWPGRSERVSLENSSTLRGESATQRMIPVRHFGYGLDSHHHVVDAATGNSGAGRHNGSARRG
ncbi:DUF817 domain-containing protein [Brachybacterium endophyticum]|uniref:DUF817 domain-containing protein n=2 Tax=Brachybacterium endophyticum TaxID=2182385 RepID=A0A2U2RKA5_9MICO|nr:DUF817 domain-containing protein [Brachybacterium endophyticum]PWH06214.1 DUF817 domain-containing protein [Brachybacterium endophyticum]